MVGAIRAITSESAISRRLLALDRFIHQNFTHLTQKRATITSAIGLLASSPVPVPAGMAFK